MHVTYPITSQREFDQILKDTFTRLGDELLSGVVAKQSAQVVTGTSFTIPNDASKFFVLNNASAQTVNLPADLSAWEVGSVITIVQVGVGLVSVDPATNVLINGVTTNVDSAGRYKAIKLLKYDTNNWVVL